MGWKERKRGRKRETGAEIGGGQRGGTTDRI